MEVTAKAEISAYLYCRYKQVEWWQPKKHQTSLAVNSSVSRGKLFLKALLLHRLQVTCTLTLLGSITGS